MKNFLKFLSVPMVFVLLMLVGCSDETPVSPLENFSPEIVNGADSFEFQITDAENVTAVVEYHWMNSGNKSSVNHSSVVTDGSAVVSLYDADGNLVYTSSLLASANNESEIGTAGVWKVRVTFVNAYGTMNFRCEKLYE